MSTPPKPTILNVDDHEASRCARSRILDRAGFRVIDAASGVEALSLVSSAEPDLILLDVNLPDMNGLELCRRIKAIPEMVSTPILHIAASAVGFQDKARGLELGADGYLVEPVEPEELVANIRALLRISQAERFSEALNRVHAAIGSTLDFDEIPRRVVVEATQAMRAETGLIAVLENGSWSVRCACCIEGLAGRRFPDRSAESGSIAAAMRDGQPVVVADARSDPRIDPELATQFGFRSMLFLPLIVRREVIGILSFHYHSGAIAFTTAQVDFGGKLAAALSLALENARLYAEAEEGRKILEALMENIPEGITIADAPDVNIRMVSRYGRAMTGRPREEIERIPAELHPDRWRVLRPGTGEPATADELPLTRATRHGEVVRDEEWWLQGPDGQKVPLLCNAGPIRDRAGAITGGVIAFRDISNLKRLESQLAQAEKMEAAGMLAGGLAHEFNNMLMVITGHCRVLLERAGGKKKRIRRSLGAILRSANRLSTLTNELLAFAGRQTIQPAVLDLNGVVRQVQPDLRQILGAQIQLTVSLAPGLHMVKADADQMGRVILNLAMRGCEVMAQGGRLAIETSNVALPPDGISEQLGLRPGDYVLVAVSDTGPPLAEETRSHIFEPFFGDAGNGRGGMGLSTSYGIARQNRGGIRMVSQPGQGNRAEIYLPRAEEQSSSRAPET